MMIECPRCKGDTSGLSVCSRCKGRGKIAQRVVSSAPRDAVFFRGALINSKRKETKDEI
jgi:hypothetical protein